MPCMIDCDRLAHWTELVRSEYAEMPGLSLTDAQMARLFNFDLDVVEAVIDVLVRARVLRRTLEGSCVAFDSAH